MSNREAPTLPILPRAQREQSYFKDLPFGPAEVACLSFPEVLAEKIRACYQRDKARDVYDLSLFAKTPLNHKLLRRLVVLKLWQARSAFEPALLSNKFRDEAAFDWEDLRGLVRKNFVIEPDRVLSACSVGYGFLRELSPEESTLSADRHQREGALWENCVANVGKWNNPRERFSLYFQCKWARPECCVDPLRPPSLSDLAARETDGAQSG